MQLIPHGHDVCGTATCRRSFVFTHNLNLSSLTFFLFSPAYPNRAQERHVYIKIIHMIREKTRILNKQQELHKTLNTVLLVTTGRRFLTADSCVSSTLLVVRFVVGR